MSFNLFCFCFFVLTASFPFLRVLQSNFRLKPTRKTLFACVLGLLASSWDVKYITVQTKSTKHMYLQQKLSPCHLKVKRFSLRQRFEKAPTNLEWKNKKFTSQFCSGYLSMYLLNSFFLSHRPSTFKFCCYSQLYANLSY